MHFLAEEGPLAGKILNFDNKKEVIIGRDPTVSDFILDDKTVSRKHARCYPTKDGFVIEDLSHTNPTLVNDVPISGPTILQEGDHVKIGQTIFIFSEEKKPKLPEEEPIVHEDVNKAYDTIFSPDEEESPLKEPSEEKETKLPEEEKNLFDTIFEEHEEELPINIIGESRFQLKVISGPNSGAEFGLDQNQTYILGKDSNTCDIVFHDMSVSRQHARLHIDENGVMSIEDLGSKNKTLVNGSEIDQKQILSSQDLISLGTTVFTVIDKEAVTETIYSTSPIIEEMPQEKIKAQIEKNWKKQIIPLKHLIFAGSFLLVMIVMILSFFSLFKSETIEISKKDYSKDIKDELIMYDDIEFSYNPGADTVFLVGHVLTSVDKQELLYRLNQLPFINKIEDNIIVDELVWKNVNEVLQDNELFRSVNVHSPKAGKFVISGYVKTANDAKDLSEYLNVNFPYLDRLENKVVIENVLLVEVGSLLISKGFSGLIFQITTGDCIITGAYDKDMKKEYDDVLKKLKLMPGIRSVKDLAIASSAQQGRIDLTDKYAITGYVEKGDENISIVVNGHIVSLGDNLDGMEITSIEKNTILLEKEGLKYKINYSR